MEQQVIAHITGGTPVAHTGMSSTDVYESGLVPQYEGLPAVAGTGVAATASPQRIALSAIADICMGHGIRALLADDEGRAIGVIMPNGAILLSPTAQYAWHTHPDQPVQGTGEEQLTLDLEPEPSDEVTETLRKDEV